MPFKLPSFQEALDANEDIENINDGKDNLLSFIRRYQPNTKLVADQWRTELTNLLLSFSNPIGVADNKKAAKWDELDRKISVFYPIDAEGEELEDSYDHNALLDIGEVAACAFGYL